MENKKNLLRISVIVVALGTILTGCKQPTDSEPTYTVWTDTVSYSDFYNIFGSLNDGYLTKITLTDPQFNSFSLSNEYKNIWTENDIYNWLYGRGLISSQANELKAWIITTKHAIVLPKLNLPKKD
jgi:hypothetical protein